eukprot:gnl/TRDRNA2_/TRDRNA2_186286_c0_seq1.p1 gnl/TRDRNA2_/TRDRNA2_186286_c0~~gnl/TRDRNA2_/TRDRNA2_186286_c0_seq1.p1  ORF type:complete len:565 (-),score=94.73 gnl/TRDRNA2_/TRDRNA2_186286_c0_seq1:141-1835(-)
MWQQRGHASPVQCAQPYRPAAGRTPAVPTKGGGSIPAPLPMTRSHLSCGPASPVPQPRAAMVNSPGGGYPLGGSVPGGNVAGVAKQVPLQSYSGSVRATGSTGLHPQSQGAGSTGLHPQPQGLDSLLRTTLGGTMRATPAPQAAGRALTPRSHASSQVSSGPQCPLSPGGLLSKTTKEMQRNTAGERAPASMLVAQENRRAAGALRPAAVSSPSPGTYCSGSAAAGRGLVPLSEDRIERRQRTPLAPRSPLVPARCGTAANCMPVQPQSPLKPRSPISVPQSGALQLQSPLKQMMSPMAVRCEARSPFPMSRLCEVDVSVPAIIATVADEGLSSGGGMTPAAGRPGTPPSLSSSAAGIVTEEQPPLLLSAQPTVLPECVEHSRGSISAVAASVVSAKVVTTDEVAAAAPAPVFDSYPTLAAVSASLPVTAAVAEPLTWKVEPGAHPMVKEEEKEYILDCLTQLTAILEAEGGLSEYAKEGNLKRAELLGKVEDETPPARILQMSFEKVLQLNARTGGDTIFVASGSILSCGTKKLVKLQLRCNGEDMRVSVCWNWDVRLEHAVA